MIGIKEGEKHGKIKVAQKMLAKGIAINEIVEITGLSIEEVKAETTSED